MKLDDTQRQKVADWINQGLKLSEVQKRLDSELGLKLTYMEVRFLMDDLSLSPKDPEKPAPKAPPAQPSPSSSELPPGDESLEDELPPAGDSRVTVSADQIAKPGMLASGKVTFSDRIEADWYFDQMGRLGLAAKQPGYRPSPADLTAFQQQLQRELSRLGMY
ncbi:MAG: hypothetical protein SFY81_15895 [Verrucomicrobiota bacterium]|nr:hypothetical protein [Verrucomicrobiota bacterium]